MPLLEGKKVLITGGSRGIGAGVVRVAMEEGADVAFIYHQSADLAKDLAQEMAARHPAQRCLAFSCDIADVTAARDTVKAVLTESAASMSWSTMPASRATPYWGACAASTGTTSSPPISAACST